MPIPSQDPIIVAPSPTPFRADDSVNYDAIASNVERWLATPLSGFVLNSENGEEAFLSEAERLEIVRTVDHVREGRGLIIAGVDCPSVTETLRMAEGLVVAGAELIRVRVPRLTSNVREYFEQVIPRVAAPVVIIHQMAPGTFLRGPTPIGAAAELLGELTAMDNVFGYIAGADLRFESRVRRFVPANRRFWAGNASLLLASAVCGADGACMMLGNVAPQACCDILRLALAGDWKQARELQTRILEIDWQILSRGAAGLKAAVGLLGYVVGSPRAPASACSPADLEQIRDGMTAAGLL